MRPMALLGREEEFQAFVEEHRSLWYRLAYRVLENREEAEDVVQETLAILWEKKNELEIENPAAYAARAVWLNSIKRRSRAKNHLALDSVPELPALRNEDSLGNYDELDPEELEQAIEELPESQQVVIRMKYYMGFSFREIGEALQISLNTAGSRCRYALETLKELLGGDNEED